jgi:hypothetical protein
MASCLPGTRLPVLRDIRGWEANEAPAHPRVFWLNGIAGVGKSTVARSICEEADKAQRLGATFFFSRRAALENLRDPHIVIPTLAYQISRHDDAFLTGLVEVLKQDADVVNQSIRVQVERLLVQPFASSNRPTPLLIVLDALDECDSEPGVKELLSAVLLAIPKLPSSLKLLITSRPESHIRGIFKQSLAHDQLILHNTDDVIVKGDIGLYLRASLGEIPKALDVDLPANWFQDGDLDALVERAGKLFIYAATSVRFVGDRVASNPRAQLHTLLGMSATSDEQPYAELDIMYLEILKAMLPPDAVRAPTALRKYQEVIGSILLLREPLPPSALEGLLGLKEGSVRGALNNLHSVVLVPKTDDGLAQFYHQSFRDFLVNPSRCKDHRFLIQTPEHETRLALRCLQQLASLKRGMAGITDPRLLNSEVPDLKEKVANTFPPEVQYACRHWASHLLAAERGNAMLEQAVYEFMSKGVLSWIEVTSLLGCVPLAGTNAHQALEWGVCGFPDFVRYLQY